MRTILKIMVVMLVHHVRALPSVNQDGRPVVDVTQGRIIGTNDTQQGVNLFAYRGIPYALPPIGNLRFMAPVANGPFPANLDASTNPEWCTQTNGNGSEDCLFLNVYTPKSVMDINATNEYLPVMVYIHGGGFGNLYMSRYDQVYPLVGKDVIVVLIQFRLGILGFMSTEDEAAPGNQGLMDQTLALQWINANIDSFGGDVTRITLFGQATGAISTHYQMMAPSAAGLFQRAILKSGNALDPWGSGRDYNRTSRELGESFGCAMGSSSELVTCLQGVDYALLSQKYNDFGVWNGQPFFFSPRVDGVFLPDEPATLIKEGRFAKVPTIVGITKDEAAFNTGEMYLVPSLIDSLLGNFSENGPASLQLLEEEDPINTANTVYNYYLGDIVVTPDNCLDVNKMFTDALMAVRNDWFLQVHADMTETFMYQYDHRGQNSTMDFYYNQGLDLPLGVDWVSHSDDNKNLFDIVEPRQDPDDILVQDIYNTLFTNFAKYGNPTPDDSILGFQWPVTNGSDLNHLSIQTSPEMMPDERQDVRNFWETLPIKVYQLLST